MLFCKQTFSFNCMEKKKSVFSHRVQFSELPSKYIPFYYISSRYPSWQGHWNKQLSFSSFSPQRSCIKFKLGSTKPGCGTWKFPVSYVEYEFSRTALLKLSCAYEALRVLDKVQTPIQRCLARPETLHLWGALGDAEAARWATDCPHTAALCERKSLKQRVASGSFEF